MPRAAVDFGDGVSIAGRLQGTVVIKAYVAGVSTRSVDDLVAALGIDSGISKSEVSRLCERLDEVVGASRSRRLDHIGFPYIYLDATHLHVRNKASQVTSMAVVVVTGISADGGREVLGLDLGDSEDEVFWRAFLTELNKRGLHSVRLVISDQHADKVAAPRRSFLGAAHYGQVDQWEVRRVPKASVDAEALYDFAGKLRVYAGGLTAHERRTLLAIELSDDGRAGYRR